MSSRVLQRLLDTVYPPRCMACPSETVSAAALCPDCWPGVDFISGCACDCCGAPVPGEAGEGRILCDECTRLPPAWDRGRAVFRYEATGRRLVLALKHADRLDMVPPLAGWLKRAAAALLEETDLIVPVPLHRFRLLRRRYNQSAELARRLAGLAERRAAVDLLVRRRGMRSQHGLDRAARHENVKDVFKLHRKWREKLPGKHILLVDDVMTTGATLSACAEVCRGAGASGVDICVLARVAQDI